MNNHPTRQEFLDVKDLDYLKSIPLSDEEFMSPKECDIILGSDCFFDILRSGKIVGSKNKPIAQGTMFGWVVAGKLNVKNKEPHELYSHFLSTENELNTDSLLQRFWETEELSVKKQFLSDEEQFCETHFKSNFKYNDEGRFVVTLPIYRDTSRLGNTKGIAISRLLAMERRFQVDKDFERQYKKFMIEYESLGHMMPVENNEKSMDPKIYFLPHHAVMKGDSVSTKLRVVFDGTCKPSNGNSLNSILGICKMLKPDLFTILVKFRLNEIAFSADIQQMYRQILIDQEDQNFQRIVWRESKDSPIREYKLCTVTYGTASAPYLATRCLFQTGLDLERDDPAVSSLIKESFYIDDLMAGAPSSEEAISLIKTLSNILEARGFHLRKWRSNSSEVLSRISSNWVGDSSNLEIHPDECSKALGLTWNSMKDIFIFNLKVNFPDNITKRSFLSQSVRLFDPLGFLTPCTVSIKIFYQQLWLLKLDWDSPLPEALATKWKPFQKEFEQVCSIHIPRWIVSYFIFACWMYCIIRYRATTSKQLMGDLPTHRVTPSRPFSVCGVDYAGPINILRYRGRGAKTTKGYIALFVCFVTKALHLELVSDLTSEAFIASLKRFCARRGAPKHIYCDNGEVITSSPEHTNDDKLSLRSRWDIVQKMKLGFWRKWKIDYLSNLQNRTKWKSPNNNFKVGEIVIIKEDNIPPATWPLGKVIETHPDPNFYEAKEIHALLNADIFFRIIKDNVYKVNKELLFRETEFGWIAGGQLQGTNTNNFSCYFLKDNDSVEDTLKLFFELESLGIKDDPCYRKDDQAMNIFKETVQYNNNRYVVELPFRKHCNELSNNISVAKKRFQSLWRSLRRDKTLYTQYKEMIQDILNQ
ncbi:DUF1758 domain-containing protein [Trichonephila clavipes]|nr:DUF1758 domain-containing protein [Trichonephila clavipes]